MVATARAYNGLVTAPHYLASEAGRDILKAGGTAVEATIAMAAVLSVVYPHMTGLGGDGFWLVRPANGEPIGIDGSGPAGRKVTPDLYQSRGLRGVPLRGPLAANTVAGTVGAWSKALEISADWSDTPLPVAALLEAATGYAEDGYAVTAHQAELSGLGTQLDPCDPMTRTTFLPDGKPPGPGARLRLPALTETLKILASEGLNSFYRGDLATRIAADLAKVGAPLTLEDLNDYSAAPMQPLSVNIKGARLHNLPAPTQGLVSLLIVALFDRLDPVEGESFGHVHGLVEATKLAFAVRDTHIGNPGQRFGDLDRLLASSAIDADAAEIDPLRAAPWPHPAETGDTVWCGAIDGAGNAVSFIQSIYFPFGSGVVLPETGIIWQNRGSAFRLSGHGPRVLAPGRKPFHTLNPAMATFEDGRIMAYGTMGGEGQPQTQSAIFSRYGIYGMGLQDAISAPRWLLGKTWGADSANLKLESRFDPALVDQLAAAGHKVGLKPAYSAEMGHAGAAVLHPDGMIEGAFDPRSDGSVAAF